VNDGRGLLHSRQSGSNERIRSLENMIGSASAAGLS
jgi:hypothetical protein